MTLLPKRRWLRFGIRTLLIAVAILCVWLTWTVKQCRFVQERREFAVWLQQHARGHEYEGHGLLAGSPDQAHKTGEIPWYRKLLGDRPIRLIVVPHWRKPDAELLFPDAVIVAVHGPNLSARNEIKRVPPKVASPVQ